ncbi:hypothetical protein Ssi03_01110 [Sphaerisporangium siamense]|uniref:Large ribosomal subunit protein bL12 C-terminal domain-containing protein n=1 Tax=Sphaerisporangium siamense TaxID=795645 RepID=A0A7W7DB79_9ACTN|nr:ribosomal protein L7/L12 [Sphaerisporangium siamense]MBB4703649.1 hypothetical protein [Sphaerisporangium siamense]GII82121.1 hypothetical protein Ssi03_01110 [Sphaerisporangium siamense]
MMGIGLPEILVLLVVGVVVVGLFAALTRRGGRATGPSYVSAWQDHGAPPSPGDVQGQAYALVAQGKKIQAIKLVREHTGLGLADAKAYVDALAESRPVPPAVARKVAPPPQAAVPAPPRDDLATRVRALKADGRAEQAVYLVRGETGMGRQDAEAFVAQL